MEIQSKRRGGRPKILDEEKRRNRIFPGFTDSEMDRIEARAASVDLEVTEFVRKVAIQSEFNSIPAINKLAISELGRIGTNLNQIAKIANATNQIDVPALTEIRMLLKEIAATATGVSE